MCLVFLIFFEIPLQEAFGSEIKIKLDLWHGLDRIRREVSNKEAFKSQFSKELTLCVRRKGDDGYPRQEPTDTEENIKQKLQNLKSKWSGKLGSSASSAIDRLAKKHSKCISELPVHYGTNRNEGKLTFNHIDSSCTRNRVRGHLLANLSPLWINWSQQVLERNLAKNR